MKRYFLTILAVVSIAAYAASTFTTNFNFEKPGIGAENYGEALNQNFDDIDTQLKINQDGITAIQNNIITLNDPYRVVITNGSNVLEELPAGTNGQVLQSQGAGVTPVWGNSGSGELSWTDYTFVYSDFNVAPSAFEQQVIVPVSVGSYIHSIKQKHSTAFSGGTISAYRTEVGLTYPKTGNFATLFDVFQTPGATVFKDSNRGATLPTTLFINAIVTGGFTSDATAGSVTVSVLTSNP